MTLWFGLALMTAAAVLAVLWPLSRRGRELRAGSDVAVYRDQLEEIERDRRGGADGGQGGGGREGRGVPPAACGRRCAGRAGGQCGGGHAAPPGGRGRGAGRVAARRGWDLSRAPVARSARAAPRRPGR